MSVIQLDLTKLLGFKIIAGEPTANAQCVSIGAKLGEKEGIKTSGSSGWISRAKVGSKVGTKSGGKAV